MNIIKLDLLMILVDPFQLGIFNDSMILIDSDTCCICFQCVFGESHLPFMGLRDF